MSVKIESRELEIHRCDYCGKEITPKTEGEFFIVAHCNGDVCYEDALGDVCKDCARALKGIFCDLMMSGNFAERYDSKEVKSFCRMMLRGEIKANG